jgi:hypothetical protein
VAAGVGVTEGTLVGVTVIVGATVGVFEAVAVGAGVVASGVGLDTTGTAARPHA